MSYCRVVFIIGPVATSISANQYTKRIPFIDLIIQTCSVVIVFSDRNFTPLLIKKSSFMTKTATTGQLQVFVIFGIGIVIIAKKIKVLLPVVEIYSRITFIKFTISCSCRYTAIGTITAVLF